jgi:hypothetical protein
MKTDPQHMLPAHLPFYRRRWFWAVVFFIFFVVSTLFAIYAIQGSWSKFYNNIVNIYVILTISYGATLFRLIPYDLFNGSGQYIGSSIYFILVLALAYKTFQKPKVLLRYPVILSILYITGMITSILLLGSFS